MRKTIGLLLCLGSLGLWAATARAQSSVASLAPPVPAQSSAQVLRPIDPRWQPSLDAFAAADRLHAPRPGGVLFVGSSSIRLWDGLEQAFGGSADAAAEAHAIIIKRGFGGSRLADVADYMDRLVLPYKPRQVVVYAGDNDLAEGATPADVLASFKRFVRGVHRDLPETRIAYLSIKPSPLRAQLIAQARAANDLIEAYSATVPNLDYIDIYSKMVDADGRPRPELFAPDMLHLNRAGYALWRQEIAAHLGPLADPSGTVAPAPALAVAGVPRAVP